jgi:hypothetical protein
MPLVQVSTDTNLKEALILRRYVDLPKFLDLLHSRCLYLRRADGFADRLEGALFPGLRASMDAVHARGDSHENADDFYRKARTGSYVSCWSIGAKDNMALWQLYGGARTCVAVTTTVGRLIRLALSWNESAELRRVDYVDHRRVSTYVIGRYTDVLKFKNEAFAYENELRLIVPRLGKDWKRNPIGLSLPIVSLDTFVRSVVLAPEAEPWFIEAVRSLCAKYDLKAPIRQSTLATLPT